MNNDLDFKNIGKGTLYEVPEGFFDQITEKTLAEAKRRELRRVSIRRKYWLAAASLTGVAALIVFGIFSDLNKSVLNNNFAADSLLNISAQNTANSNDTATGISVTGSSVVTNTAVNSEIDKILSSLSDEEINLLADLSYSDVFFDQPQQ